MPSPGRSSRLAATAASVLLGILLLLGPLAPPASAATPATALDATFATLLNTLRTTRGLGSLSLDPELSGIARSWSVQMASSNTLSHNGSLTSQATGWAKIGENVGTGGLVTSIFDAFVASPLHLRNIADGEFTRIGVGTVTDGKGQIWTTHVFMRPKAVGSAGPVAAAPAPTAAPAPPATKAPKAPATTAAPATAPPTTAAAPVTAPAPAPTTAAAPAPSGVEVAGSASPAEATPPVSPALTPAGDSSPSRFPVLFVAGAALLALLLVVGAGFLLNGSSERGSLAEVVTGVLNLR